MPPAEERIEGRVDGSLVLPEPDVSPEHGPVRERLPRWARRAVAAAIAGAVLGGAYLFSRSAFFAVDDIRVLGTLRLTTARVIRESGIDHGTNVLSVDVEAVEIKLERDPWIASASVERSLPGTITIEVRERVAVLAIERDGAFDLVAADGTVLGSGARAAHLPVVRFSAALPQPSAVGPAEAVAALDPDARIEVRAIDVDALGAITFELRAGASVRFGTPTRVQSKAEALTAMLVFAQENRVHFVSIDLRFPGAPSAQLDDGSRFEP
ncbi:MAG TPA: FtsQ-type POTRA domain-containing protein [Actinomycetota bacterium]|jgi:cell division protein FtsQ|nr:FtsQ-type POTRA domain-containing protein [Actinomycetota bacterium]